MISRLSRIPQASRATDISWLPLTTVPLATKYRPAVLVTVGQSGASHVEHGLSAGWVVLADDAEDEHWKAAMVQVLGRPGANCRLIGASHLPIVIVGQAREVRDAWESIHQRIDAIRQQVGGSQATVAVLVMELGSESGEPPTGVDIWFQVTPHYADGSLDGSELSQLVGWLIERQVPVRLYSDLSQMRVRGRVLLTATVGWVPRVSVGEVVALQWRIGIRAGLLHASPARRLHNALCSAASRPMLSRRLREHLERDASSIRDEFARESHRFEPANVFPSQLALEAASPLASIVERWCEEQWRKILEEVVTVWNRPFRLADVRGRLREELNQLRQESRDVSARENLENAQLARVSAEGRRALERWLAGRGRMSGRVVGWWRVRSVRRLLDRYLELRSAVLLWGSMRRAIEQLSERLERLDGQFEQLLAESGNDEELLRNLLTPQHSCQFAPYDLESMMTLSAQLAERFSCAPGGSGQDEVWRLVVGDVVAALSEEKPSWDLVISAARESLESSPKAADPFAKACRSLTPQYRQDRSRQLMLRAALPARSGDDARYSRPIVLEPDLENEPGALPIAMWVRWDKPGLDELPTNAAHP